MQDIQVAMGILENGGVIIHPLLGCDSVNGAGATTPLSRKRERGWG